MSFRRSAAVLAAAFVAAGCQKVKQEPPPASYVVASYGSPYLPTPNDLALAGSKDLPASAQRALLQVFAAQDGFPGDQGVAVTIPFRRYVFDGARNTYLPVPAAIDPASVTSGAAATFVLFQISGEGVTSPTAVAWELDPDASGTAQVIPPGPPPTAWNLSLRKPKDPASGSRKFAPGRYVFAVRGGASGVRTTLGERVGQDTAVALAVKNVPFTNKENRPPGMGEALAAQAESIRQALWVPLEWNPVRDDGTGLYAWEPSLDLSLSAAFDVVRNAAGIPPSEVAAIATFEIGAARPVAPVDSASGIVPLPVDLARTGPVGALGARTIAYNPAFGSAAAGLTSLDGFSTTAMMLAPVTVPIAAETVNGATVHVFKLGQDGSITLLKELKQELKLYALGAGGTPTQAQYAAEPDPITVASGSPLSAALTCPLTVNRCAPTIGLQPAVGAATPLGTIYLPPLEEATDYAVVITTGVKDVFGRPLEKSTIAKVLLDAGFDPVADPTTGASLLSGISDDTAGALSRMRAQLAAVVADLGNHGVRVSARTTGDIALAYTFRTQGGMTATALQLVLPPYEAGTGVVDATFFTTTQIAAATAYRMDPGMLVSPTGLASVAEVRFNTISYLLDSQNSGLLDPAHPTPELVTALVAIPDPSVVPSTACGTNGYGYPAGNMCAPLVVYNHGLTNSKADMLPLAAALASRGFVVAAIDAQMQGDRSYCTSDLPSAVQCRTGSHCVYRTNLTTPVDVDANGDPIQIGRCRLDDDSGWGSFVTYRADYRTVTGCSNPAANMTLCGSGKGTALVSGNRLVTLNFFRIRDAMRQDVIDVSALAKALAPLPGSAADAFSTELSTRGISVDFRKVYFLGHSYGAISGAMSLAVNPRITRAVTYAGGATAIDVFSNPKSHYFADNLVPMLSAAGIPPDSSDFLKTLQIGKWILDPADPANFLRFALGGALPPAVQGASNSPFDPAILGTTTALFALYPAQPARDVLVQMSYGDRSVPNDQNTWYAAQLGLSVPAIDSSATDSFVQWYEPTTLDTVVSHSNLLDFAVPSLTQQAQSNAGAFLSNPTGQAAVVTP